MSTNEIAILDFGSQYTHLIARRVRELGVVSHIYSTDVKADELKNAKGIILSGGPRSIVSQPPLPYDPEIFNLNIPILGLCYGHQLIATHFGGKVGRGESREYGVSELILSSRAERSPAPHGAGRSEVEGSVIVKNVSSKDFSTSTSSTKVSEVSGRNDIFSGIPNSINVWMSHGDHVEALPEGFKIIGSSQSDPHSAVANLDKNIYGFQFHPEVTHSENGKQMISNFIFDICKAEKNWTISDTLEKIQAEIRKEAGNKKVFLLISGGVDSTVAFALLEKTLGKDRVYGFHVDHGFMRENESNEVKQALAEIGLDDLHVYDASREFYKSLENISEPEEKRKIIGDLFLDIANRTMQEIDCNEDEWLLGQGTIYPDTIESGGTDNADKIKTHHNRVDRVQEMIEKSLIIEPLKELYKDEVRQIGLKLGLPENLIHRHPFPGPGLAIRCLCSKGSSNSSEKIQKSEISNLKSQIYKLPIQSVGVQGDERTYAHPAVLSLKEFADKKVLSPLRGAGSLPAGRQERGSGQTAQTWELLEQLSPQLTNQHPDINRVLITIYGDETKLEEAKLKKAYLTHERLEKLRKLDQVVNKIILNSEDCGHIWQMPIVLVPFGYDHGESLVLRPVESEEAMTVKFARLSDKILKILHSEFSILNLVDFVFFDITNKPPGTIEWE